MQPVDYVDLDRFSGDWFVIASIPTPLEKNIFNATESYAINDDGTVATTFSYNKGGFDGPRKSHNPKGFIRDTQSNAVWGMQFVWPIKADYRVIYLDDGYAITVIGRQARDFLWIMAREPAIDDTTYASLLEFVAERGYDPAKVQRVPQRWES